MLLTLFKGLFGRSRAQEESWHAARAAALQQQGRFAEASALARARLEVEPRDVAALQALAAAYLALGQTSAGVAALEKAAALVPADASLHLMLARIHAAVGNVEQALASYRRALEIEPASGAAADDLVDLLKATGHYDEAEARCRSALALAGDTARRRHALGGVLFEQGRVPEAIAELEAALAIEADAPLVHSDLLRAQNYVGAPLTLWEAHREWGLRHAAALTRAAGAHENDPDPHRRLRIGYVSPYFRKHAVTFFLESVLAHHDRDRCEVVLFADVARPDDYSRRLMATGAKWRSTVGASDEALSQMVREERIDILVDLSGHTPGHRLLAFARRPAPVQVTWNGYPNTTGMSAMDYRITDEACDPAGVTDALHTERLSRLKGIFMSWCPPPDAPDVGPPPALASGQVTFGSFNSCYKITPELVAIWSRILKEAGGSRLVLFAVPAGRAQMRLRERFTTHAIDPSRLEFRPRMSHEAFLEAHREIDVALDSFPYHGTTTTCFSLWMGVPVVSLIGSAHVSRVGLSLLGAIGLEEFAVSTADDYVAAALSLAADPRALASLRAGMRARMLRSRLTDGKACARELDAAYRGMWAAWCAGPGAAVSIRR